MGDGTESVLLLFQNKHSSTGCQKKTLQVWKILTKAVSSNNQIIIFSKSAISSLNFDRFLRIFGDLVAQLK